MKKAKQQRPKKEDTPLAAKSPATSTASSDDRENNFKEKEMQALSSTFLQQNLYTTEIERKRNHPANAAAFEVESEEEFRTPQSTPNPQSGQQVASVLAPKSEFTQR